MSAHEERGELVVAGATTPRGRYPHVRRAGPWLFVSGTSSRRPDNTIAGATIAADGQVSFDIAVQTREVLAAIERYLGAAGAAMSDLVDLTTFLVDMSDFGGYNTVYNSVFGDVAPARTTVAVHQLPHPHLRIEIKATAYLERPQQ